MSGGSCLSTCNSEMTADLGSVLCTRDNHVPKGTKTVGLFGKDGEIVDADGKSVFSFNGREPSHYSTPVPKGQDGRLWKVRGGRGPVQLLTVPPSFARSSEELLPMDVVSLESML